MDIEELLTTFKQGGLLPAGRLRSGFTFTAAPRRAIDEVVGINGWVGK